MRRIFAGLVAATLGALLVVLPPAVSPAQAADTVRAFACISTIDPKCAGANLPILAEAGIVSAGGTTAATGGTAAVAASGALGTLGFKTVLGAGAAAITVGLLKLYGVDEGLFIETDPDHSEDGAGGQYGPLVCYTLTSGATSQEICVGYAGPAVITSGTGSGNAIHCFIFDSRFTGTPITSQFAFTLKATPTVLRTIFLSTAATTTCAANYGPAEEYEGVTGTGAWRSSSPTTSLPDEVVLYGRSSGTTSWIGTPGEAVNRPTGYHGDIRTVLECIAPGWSAPSVEMRTERIDVDPGERIPVPAIHCTAPAVAKSARVEYRADGTTEWVELGSGDATATVTTLVDDYPSCFSSTGATLCELQLQIKEGTRWESCGPLAEYCPDWVREWSETPDLYRCRFGSYDVPMARCSAFRQPGTLLPNHETDESGTPQPVPPTAPAPNPLPNQTRDPETGEPVPLPSEVPGSQQQERECWPSGFGIFNPLSWVLMPIRCAFEPSPQKVQQFQTTIRGKWETSAPGRIVGGVGSAFDAAATVVEAGSCEGVYIPTGWLNRDAFAGAGIPSGFWILNACPGSPLQPWAAFSFVLISGAMIVVAIRVIPAQVGKLVNYGGISG